MSAFQDHPRRVGGGIGSQRFSRGSGYSGRTTLRRLYNNYLRRSSYRPYLRSSRRTLFGGVGSADMPMNPRKNKRLREDDEEEEYDDDADFGEFFLRESNNMYSAAEPSSPGYSDATLSRYTGAGIYDFMCADVEMQQKFDIAMAVIKHYSADFSIADYWSSTMKPLRLYREVVLSTDHDIAFVGYLSRLVCYMIRLEVSKTGKTFQQVVSEKSIELDGEKYSLATLFQELQRNANIENNDCFSILSIFLLGVANGEEWALSMINKN